MSMFEQIAKQILLIRDDILMECLVFLENCEGRDVITNNA